MKITFIGTSHGVPSKDRHCTSIMIESGKKTYFIDAGASIIDAILKNDIDIHDFRAVFTTHAHGDHVNGIFQVADLMNWYYRDCGADFYLTDLRLKSAFEQMIKISCNDREADASRIRFKLADVGLVYEDENIKVEYIKNAHMDTSPSYSVLVSEGEKSVLFSGDLSGHLAANDVPPVLAQGKVDAFVSELAHFEVSEIKPYIDNSNCKKIFFTHIYPDQKFDDVRQAFKSSSFDVCLPSDNDSYEI